MQREPWVFLFCFLVAAGAGFASLFRSRQSLTARAVLSTVLYSGTVGLVIGLLWFNYFSTSSNGPWTLLGICGLAGLAGVGGVSIVDYLVQFITGGGLSVRIHIEKDNEDEDNDAPVP